MSDSPFLDNLGRRINYMRLSVTDRCNLSCIYCRRRECDFLPHQRILTYEENLELISLARSLGVDKVRLTGGEPFLRKDFLGFVARAVRLFPDTDFRVTTNATLIPDRIKEIREAGLTRLNISLDTLDREKFFYLCGRDLLPRVWRAIENALGSGLRIKINTVAMRGVNDGELPDFIELARTWPLDVRFIEFMPMDGGEAWDSSRVWTAGEILSEAGRYAGLTPVQRRRENSGPARVFEVDSGRGRLGIISPLTEHFCASCNRFRITSDGRLRTCLFADKGYRLRPLLRNPRLGREQVLRVLRLAGVRKPMGHKLLQKRCNGGCSGNPTMSGIGG